MDTIKVEGAELSSLTLGPPGSSAVAMLHGLVFGNMASWYSPLALPLSASRRVVLYDQRGHGGSSLPTGGFDLDSQAADLDLVLRHHGLASASVDLIGHSMGALIALRFALRHPGRVRRLALVDAPMPARDHVGSTLRHIMSQDGLAAYLEAQPGARGGTGRIQDRLYRRLSALFFGSTLIADVLAMDMEPEASLAALQMPVLLVFGARSPCIGAGHHLQRLLPQGKLILIDCGHYILEEAPALLRAHIEKFLHHP